MRVRDGRQRRKTKTGDVYREGREIKLIESKMVKLDKGETKRGEERQREHR
jgi:hypothetical protein